MRTRVDTSLPPDFYAIFIVSRWAHGDRTVKSVRGLIEYRIKHIIQTRGAPKTAGMEQKYLAAAVLSLSMTRSAADAITQHEHVADLFEPWMDR